MGKFVLVVVLFAAAVYGVMWLLERRRVARSHGPAVGGAARKPEPRPRVVAPDDDEEFLRDLGRRRRTDDGPPVE